MTGFGRAEGSVGTRSLVAEVRSVNHRFLESSLRLPRGLQALESPLRAYLGERLSRGKINLNLNWKGEHEGAELTWDADLAQRYHDVLQELRAKFDFREPVTLGHLTGHPDILRWEEPTLDPDESWDEVRTVVDAAVSDLLGMREAEGAALEKELRGRVDSLREGLAAVEARAPHRAAEAKEKLRSRVAELLKGEAEVDEERLLVEAAFQAERMDCTEECVRLTSHLDQFLELLSGSEPSGRKLNFLLQEMNREANTIGSKGNDVTVAREVIRLKEDVEILREQVQNIE